jgi:hypothetical protein
MKKQVESLSSTNSQSEDHKVDAGNLDVLLSTLCELWRTRHRTGLEVRLQTGSLLNKQFGSPEDRQPYGKGVVKRLTKELGVSQSELSRMRWFAHRFESLEALHADHRDVMTWKQVKEILPSLRPSSSKAVKADKTTPATQTTVPSMVMSINEFRKMLSTAKVKTKRQRENLKEAVDAMIEDLNPILGVNYVRSGETKSDVSDKPSPLQTTPEETQAA